MISVTPGAVAAAPVVVAAAAAGDRDVSFDLADGSRVVLSVSVKKGGVPKVGRNSTLQAAAVNDIVALQKRVVDLYLRIGVENTLAVLNGAGLQQQLQAPPPPAQPEPPVPTQPVTTAGLQADFNASTLYFISKIQQLEDNIATYELDANRNSRDSDELKKKHAAVVAELNELRNAPNAKVHAFDVKYNALKIRFDCLVVEHNKLKELNSQISAEHKLEVEKTDAVVSQLVREVEQARTLALSRSSHSTSGEIEAVLQEAQVAALQQQAASEAAIAAKQTEIDELQRQIARQRQLHVMLSNNLAEAVKALEKERDQLGEKDEALAEKQNEIDHLQLTVGELHVEIIEKAVALEKAENVADLARRFANSVFKRGYVVMAHFRKLYFFDVCFL